MTDWSDDDSVICGSDDDAGLFEASRSLFEPPTISPRHLKFDAAETPVDALAKTLKPATVTPAPTHEWRQAIDASTGDTYYYNRATRATAWELPPGAVVAGKTAVFSRSPVKSPLEKVARKVNKKSLATLKQRVAARQPPKKDRALFDENAPAQPRIFCVYCGDKLYVSCLAAHLAEDCPARDRLAKTVTDLELQNVLRKEWGDRPALAPKNRRAARTVTPPSF